MVVFGDTSIPIEERKNWVWQQLALVCPEMERSKFPVDDPYAFGEIVLNNCYRYTPKIDAKVMDIGANIGVFTMMCALKGCQVTAYEPNPHAYEILYNTVFRNQVGDRVALHPCAVYTHTGLCSYHPTVTRPQSVLQTWSSFNGAVNTPGQDPDELYSCDSFEKVIGDDIWDCVKMDIEGAEFPILLNLDPDREILRHIKYFTIELHNGHATKTEHDLLIQELNNVFRIDGVKDGDPLWAHEDRYISLFCTRR